MVRIYETDDYFITATKIFNEFAMDQSCTISGYVIIDGEPLAKGDMVLKELERIDIFENGSRGKRRVRKILPDSIGGYVSQKIFKYKKRVTQNYFKVDIWRVQ